MVATVSQEIADFFDHYAQAGDRADAAALEGMFLPSFLALDPTSANVVPRAALLASLGSRRQMFGDAGVDGMALESVTSTSVDERHALADTRWSLRMDQERRGADTQHVRATYLLRKEDGSWRIAVYLNHEDLPRLLAALPAAPSH